MADRQTRRITLVMVREDKDAVLGELMAEGCVEITGPDALLGDPELAGLLAREGGGCDELLDELRAEEETIALGLDILEYYSPSAKGERARLKVTHGEFFDENAIADGLALTKTLEMLDTKIQVLSDAESVEQSQERLQEVAVVRDIIAAQIASEAKRRPSLKIAYDHIGVKAAIAAETEKLLGTEYALVLVGWFPAKSEQRLVRILSKHPCVWEFQTPPSGDVGVPFSPGGNIFRRIGVAFFKLFNKDGYRGIEPLRLSNAYTDIMPDEPVHGKHRIEEIDGGEIEDSYTINIESSGEPTPTGIDPEGRYTGEIELPDSDGQTADAKKPNAADGDWVNDDERY
jgi:hypothetical protein